MSCPGQSCPPLPQSLPQAREKGCFWPLLQADDVAGPGFVFGAWCQMGDDNLDGLQLLVLGWDGAHLIGDLVAFHRDVLPFHAAEVGGERAQSPALRNAPRGPPGTLAAGQGAPSKELSLLSRHRQSHHTAVAPCHPQPPVWPRRP